MAITTVARLKSRLGIPATVTFHDSSLGLVVDGVNDYLLDKLGQASHAANTFTEYPRVYSEGITDILLQRTPVVSIIAITNGSALVSASSYRVDTEIGLVRLNQGTVGISGIRSYWATGPDGVAVTYTAGYTSANTPARLVNCADIIASACFGRARSQGKSEERVISHLTRFDIENAMPVEARMILNNFVDMHRF